MLPNHPDFWICEFAYQGKDWQKTRILKAIRWIDKYEKKEYFGRFEWMPIYSYACYVTSLELDAWCTHEKYKPRATSETWIEQIKSQLYAGMSLTDDFWANDTYSYCKYSLAACCSGLQLIGYDETAPQETF